jgi:predicted enzyme related to lactoylglutathione lyase
VANGGKITMPKMVVPGVGYSAYFADPEGNIFGMMEADESAK